MKPWIIYALSDPRDPDAIRYVGKTQAELMTRLSGHLHYATKRKSNCHVSTWIRKLLREGYRPTVTILEHGDASEDWRPAEVRWIARCRDQGHNICNSTAGGDGSAGYKKTSEAIAKTILTTKATWERKKAAGWKITGDPSSPEGRARTTAALVGHECTPETRAKIGAANRGRVMSPEARAKMSAAKKGKPPHNKGKPGVKPTAETRAKLSEAQKARWARQKSEAA